MYNLYLHPLAHFPGPPLWAASRIPHELGLARGRIIRDLATLHDKYGEVVRVSPNALSFIHPDAWNDIYARKPGLPPFPKDMGRYLDLMNFNDAQVILIAGDADHARQRRVLSPGFSEKGIRDQEPVVQTHATLLIQRLRERIHDRPTAGKVDISLWLNWATFDVVGDLVFGEPFGCLQKNEFHPWVALLYGLERDLTFITIAKQFPWLNYIAERLLPALFMEKLNEHQKLTKEKIDRRIQSGSDRADIINIILKQDGTERELSRDEIYSNAVLIILAGSETSSAAMAGCVYFLAQNPQVMHILKNEIRSRFAHEDEITFQALSSLTYLTAVLDESMRLYPAVPIFTSRVAPSGGAAVAGHFVPENVGIPISSTSSYVPISLRWQFYARQFTKRLAQILMPFRRRLGSINGQHIIPRKISAIRIASNLRVGCAIPDILTIDHKSSNLSQSGIGTALANSTTSSFFPLISPLFIRLIHHSSFFNERFLYMID